ncbi:MAG: response regulator [Oscillospiraceae bacterium]|nr:response regulator [Oscillospiraceae bacterium]
MIEAKKHSILVVDDENSNIMALTHILISDYIVYAAKNGESALDAANKYLPDIIMLDIIMPDMDGYGVLAALKESEKTKNIPVIFTTGLGDAGDEEKGLTLGASDYLIKPFSPALVKLRVLNQVKLIEQFRTYEYDVMKYKLANDALNIALWDMDVVSKDPINPNNRFVWSQEFRNMLGFTNENDFPDVLHSWSDRLHPDDKERALKAFAAHMNDYTGNTPFNVEYRLRLKDGEYRYFHALGTTSRDKDGVPVRVAGAIMDIDRKKQIEKEAGQLAEAEESSKAKSAFLANMSHEIRTPMNAIWGITEILMQDNTLPEQAKDGLGRIYNSCGLLLGIINDILDFSKIEAGKLDIMPAKYNIASLINDSIQLNIMRLGDKPVEFEVEIDERIPAELIGDELRIKQILNNLMSNAIKYTDAGKIVLSGAFEHCKSNAKKGELILSVEDTGIGMTKQQIDKLFDEYSRFSREDGKTIEGTGLGMAITSQLLNLMSGSVSVISEPGKGSVFTVRLLQDIEDGAVLGAELAENLRQYRKRNFTSSGRVSNQVVRDYMPYGSVLIVDDVETNLYVAEGLMKPYGLKIDFAMSGLEAIERVKSGKIYDVIFMDHMMPVMDGVEAAKQIRNLGYKEPVVALTANALVGSANMFLSSGFNDFISKPIDIRRLNSVLNKLIRDKQPPEVLEAARGKQAGAGTDKSAQSPLVTESFIVDAGKAVSVMRETLESCGDEKIREFTVAVHGIKSALAFIGETELCDFAQKLESAGHEKNTGFIKDYAPDFCVRLTNLIDDIKSKQYKETDAGEEDAAYLRDRLSDVLRTCGDYNRKGALEILEEIKQKGVSKETREVLNFLTELVMHGEYGETAEKITEFLDGYKNQVEIDGIDLARGLERYEGDRETYYKILRSYAASVRSMLAKLDNLDLEKPGDLKIYEITVHGIKGASYDIFANGIADAAKALELSAKSGGLDYIEENGGDFIVNLKKLISEIEDMLSVLKNTGKNQKQLKSGISEEEILKLIEACNTYDMDGADAAMAEIEKYVYESETDNNLADWLRENVDSVNFAGVGERLTFLFAEKEK